MTSLVTSSFVSRSNENLTVQLRVNLPSILKVVRKNGTQVQACMWAFALAATSK